MSDTPTPIYPLRIRNVRPGPVSEWGFALIGGLSAIVCYSGLFVAIYLGAEWKLPRTLVTVAGYASYLVMLAMIGGALYLHGTRRIVLYDGAICCGLSWRASAQRINRITLLPDLAADYAENATPERLWLVRIQWLRVFRHRLHISNGDAQLLIAWAQRYGAPLHDQREPRDA